MRYQRNKALDRHDTLYLGLVLAWTAKNWTPHFQFTALNEAICSKYNFYKLILYNTIHNISTEHLTRSN